MDKRAKSSKKNANMIIFVKFFLTGVGALHKLLGINIVKPNQTKFFKARPYTLYTFYLI